MLTVTPTVLGTMRVVPGEDPPGVCTDHMAAALHLVRPICHFLLRAELKLVEALVADIQGSQASQLVSQAEMPFCQVQHAKTKSGVVTGACIVQRSCIGRSGPLEARQVLLSANAFATCPLCHSLLMRWICVTPCASF